MAKDAQKALAQAQERDHRLKAMESAPGRWEVVDSAYRRTFTQEERVEIERGRALMRERLTAPG